MIRLSDGRVVAPNDWTAITAQVRRTRSTRDVYTHPFVSFWVLASDPHGGKTIVSQREVYYAINGKAHLVGTVADAPRLLGAAPSDVAVYARGLALAGCLLFVAFLASEAGSFLSVPVGGAILWWAFRDRIA